MTTAAKRKNATAASKTPAGKDGFSLISNEKLLSLYANLLKCRLLDERARQSGAVGWEAAAVGVAIDLRAEDTVVALGREFNLGFLADEPLGRVAGQLVTRTAGEEKYGTAKERSGEAARGIAPPSDSADRLHTAIGVALANKTKKNGRIAVVFSGEGAASLDAWREALCVAGAHELPMIFISRNSLAKEPARGRTNRIAANFEEFGFPAIPVDANDVVAVYRVACEMISRARRGSGPTLIECIPFKSDAARRFAAVAPPQADDPILNMEVYLARKGLFSADLKQRIEAEVGKRLDETGEVAVDSSLSD
jgi:TPP-dependent pyruvate/acetoin dehydrogenase alpha subunit